MEKKILEQWADWPDPGKSTTVLAAFSRPLSDVLRDLQCKCVNSLRYNRQCACVKQSWLHSPDRCPTFSAICNAHASTVYNIINNAHAWNSLGSILQTALRRSLRSAMRNAHAWTIIDKICNARASNSFCHNLQCLNVTPDEGVNCRMSKSDVILVIEGLNDPDPPGWRGEVCPIWWVRGKRSDSPGWWGGEG